MQRVATPSHSQPLFGTAATRRIEAELAGTVAPHTLMRRAGEAVARLTMALAPHAQHVWIAAGPGNNGGDGLEAALQLRRLGKHVVLTHLADSRQLPADAAAALARAQAAGVSIGSEAGVGSIEPDVAIDALLGLGAARAPSASLAAGVARLNALRCPVLAVDLPSGLNADTGQPFGGACVRATHTLSLLTLKPGLFTGVGRDHAGDAWLDTLGAVTHRQPPDAWLFGGDAARAAIPLRRHAQHKGSFGDVAVVGGAPGMTGAALLAARAAHAAGAGRVYVNLLDAGAACTHDIVRPELMFRSAMADSPPEWLNASTVVCGCGGGDAVRPALPLLLSRAGRLVLDADALNAIAHDTALQALLRARRRAGRPTVLTPHPLEAARLLGRSTAQVQADRLASAQHLAERFDCVVLLKGSGTVVAAPDAVPCVNPTGNASLASAGTGDVLAGWLAGLWSRAGGSANRDSSGALPTDTTPHAMNIAAAAAYQHGRCAPVDALAALRAGDLIEHLHRALDLQR